MNTLPLPKNLNHTSLQLYFNDPLEFEARHIYNLKKSSPFKNFVKKIDDENIQLYDDAIFWNYQKKRIQENLKIKPLYEIVSAPFGEHTITERIDYIDGNTVVCFTMRAPPKHKDIRAMQSLRLPLCGYCARHSYQMPIDRLEYWHFKGYKDVIEKVVYPIGLIDEVMQKLSSQLLTSSET